MEWAQDDSKPILVHKSKAKEAAVTASVIGVLSPEVEKLVQPKKKSFDNQACHLTEEMPVHLL